MDSKKKRLRLRLAYDGTDFWGWQKQPQNPPTIQGALESCLKKIYQQDVAVVGSGRTDRGVHALNQWAHFDLPESASVDQLAYKLQRMTPPTVTIISLELCPLDFHAQISAQKKTYIYRLDQSPRANPFGLRYCWSYPKKLDFEYLQEASNLLLGKHDFSSFQSRGTPVTSPVRILEKCLWRHKRKGLWVFEIRGNGFLKQMVRNIVGTLIQMAENQAPSQEILHILHTKNRQMAAAPAPPQGLFLSAVEYPEQLDNKCRKL